MIGPILLAVGRLVGLTVLGFFLFKIPVLRRYLLPALLFLAINVLFPLYSIHNFPKGWDDAVAAGWPWMLGSFLACVAYIALQFALGRFVVRRLPVFPREHEKELVLLFAVQNAGYIPLPIIAALAPSAILVYMFFFVFAFNVVFWTVAVGAIADRGGRRFVFKPNMPVVGLLVGLVIAAFDLERYIPAFIDVPIGWAAGIALDLILVLLGGILGSIPSRRFRLRKEFLAFVLIKMVAYPAVFLVLAALIPMPGLRPDIAAGIRLTLVLQAAVPPATNIMVATRAYGTSEEVDYLGAAVIVSYASMAITLPVFLLLSTVLFGL